MKLMNVTRKLTAAAFALLMLLMILSLTACSSAAPEQKQSGVTPSDITQDEPLAPSLTALESLVGSDGFQEKVQTESKKYEAQGMKLAITAQGNTLIYTCSYTVDGVDLDDAKKTLSDYLDSDAMVKNFDDVLESVRKTVPETESVKVIYVDSSGNEITSHEYR